uniref:Phosphoinositide phospholipase C n=1 Tax=Cannabis sativa TaxID=3483 RepID=A0A803PSB9_CANSA
MSKQTYRVCFCFRRRFRLAATEAPKDVKDLFDQYSENGFMTVDHFHRFLVYQDMTAPLSHYFIYTGHNSYLTGNQLSSDCSDVPIIKALQKGVRVIELDIWPNSNKDNVEVLHGRTLTTPVELLKCLKSIKEYAFVASEYPVVITLEDHLTPDLQAKVAEMVTQTFGDVLFSPGTECLKEFPSPESLKKRIIISTKPPKEYLEAKDAKENESDSQKGKAASDEEAWGKKSKSKISRTCQGSHSCIFESLTLREHAFDSSNYKPTYWVVTWSFQMVAFNMQVTLVDAWNVQTNGGCICENQTFLLKIIPDNEVFDPKVQLPVKKTLKNWQPIEVHEYDMSQKDDFGGQACLPVSELKQGIQESCFA